MVSLTLLLLAAPPLLVKNTLWHDNAAAEVNANDPRLKEIAPGLRNVTSLTAAERSALSAYDRAAIALLQGDAPPDEPIARVQSKGLLTERLGASRAPEQQEARAAGWVKEKSLVCAMNGKRTVIGVGEVSGISDPSLARTTAGNRARAEIATHEKKTTLEGVEIYEDAWLGQRYLVLAALEGKDAAPKTLKACPFDPVTVRYWTWLELAPDGSEAKRAPKWTKDAADVLVRDDSEISLHIVSAEKTTPHAARPIMNVHARLETLLAATKEPCVKTRKPGATPPTVFWDSTLRQLHLRAAVAKSVFECTPAQLTAAFGEPIVRSRFGAPQADEVVKWMTEELVRAADRVKAHQGKTLQLRLELTKKRDDPGMKLDQLRARIMVAVSDKVTITDKAPGVVKVWLDSNHDDEPTVFTADYEIEDADAGSKGRLTLRPKQ